MQASCCHFITNWPIIKWDIIDYYGEEKKSFDFVKKSYQPLLCSLKFLKRRYLPGENFDASLWVVNDYHLDYVDVDYCYQILNKNGEEIFADSFKVNINQNSSEEFKNINWTVTGNIGETFIIKICLKNVSGEIISQNEYSILINDQEKAKIEAKELYSLSRQEREKYGRGYYRYAPDWIDTI